MGQCEEVRSQRVGTCDVCAALSGDAKSSNTADSTGRADCVLVWAINGGPVRAHWHGPHHGISVHRVSLS